MGDFLTESRITGSNGKSAKKLTVKLWKKGVVPKEEIYSGSLATQYFIRKSGQFIYGKLDFLNQAFGIIPPELDGYETTLDAPAFDIDQNVNSRFLLEYIARENFYLHYGSMANGSRKARRVHVNTLFDMPFIAPSFEEQKAIGEFFKQLDRTIDFHQRTQNKYKNLKNAYLEKLFSNKSHAWVQRKLGDVVEIVGGGTPDTNNAEFWGGQIDWYSPTEIGNDVYATGSQKTITSLGLEKSSAKILPANKTILFTSRAGIGDMAILLKEGATNQGFQSLVINDNVDIHFLYSMGSEIKEFALKNASGSTFLEISKNELSKMPINLPTLPEQQAIGEFFRQLDDTIATHQRELLKYQQLKEILLKKMFV